MDIKCLLVAGELEEERSDHCRSWRGRRRGYGGVDLVEEGVVEGKERVANGKDFACDSYHFWPPIELLVCV